MSGYDYYTGHSCVYYIYICNAESSEFQRVNCQKNCKRLVDRTRCILRAEFARQATNEKPLGTHRLPATWK